MDAQMLTEVLKAAIGPFLGAGLAFLSTRIHDAHRRHQENTAAGNLALTTLNSMLNEHYLWRAGKLAIRFRSTASSLIVTDPGVCGFSAEDVFKVSPWVKS